MKKLAFGIAAVVAVMSVQADTYYLKEKDAAGKSSIMSGASSGAGKGWETEDKSKSTTYMTDGNDFVSKDLGVRTPNKKYDSDTQVPGDSLTIRTTGDINSPATLITKHYGTGSLVFNNLILENGMIAISDSEQNDGKGTKYLGGKITVAEGYAGYIGSSVGSLENDKRYLVLENAFVGSGTLVFRLAGNQVGVTIEGDGSTFTGPVYVGNGGAMRTDTAPGGGTMTFAADSVWFGAMAAFDANGFTVNGGGKVVFNESIASDATRGWTLNGNPELNVAEGEVVSVAAPVAGAGFKKVGAGTLALAAATESLSGTVAVNAGTLKTSDPAALGAAALTFAEGAALEVDVTAGALELAYAPSGLGKLAVSGTAEGDKIPVLSYEGAEIDVAALDFVCGLTGASADAYKLVSEASAGVVTIYAVNASSAAYAFSISAAVKTLTMNSATFTVTVSVAEGADVGDAVPVVTGVYGATAGGTAVENWEHSADFSEKAPGVYELTLSGLAPNAAYSVAFTAFAEGFERCWSENLRISTGGVTVSGPAKVYENDGRSFNLVVARPVEASTDPVTVSLVYSEGVESLVSALPETVTLVAGAVSTNIPFTVIDNAATGDATFTATIVASDTYVLGDPHVATVCISDDESLVPAECEWTGGGDGTSWSDTDNWKDGACPTSVDIARFTASGLTAKQSVMLTENAIAGGILLDGSPEFTLSSAGASLALGSIEITTDSGNLTVAAPLVLTDGGDANCIWNIGASRTMTISAELAKIGDITVLKTGAGNVNMSYQNTTFSGPWNIREGTITANVDQGKTFRGTVSIGGGDQPAKLYQSKKNSIAATTVVNVYTNGTYQSGDIDNGRAATIRVYEGGFATVGSYYYIDWLTLQGGTFKGGTAYNAQSFSVNASDTMSVLDATWRFLGNSYDINVARGTAPVDLKISKALNEGGSDKTLTKKGDGIVKSTANFSVKNKITISAGTWYVDNPSENGLGIQETTVAKGATIGGVGFVGMKDSKGGATLTLNAGDETTYATIAPGTIDEVTGAHSNGTFTVAREAAHNALSLGNYSHLVIGAGPKNRETQQSVVDKLMVYGELKIGENCTLDLVSNTYEDITKIKGGTYTIVEAVDGITGTFATELKPRNSWRVNYVRDEADGLVKRIDLTILPPGLAVIFR